MKFQPERAEGVNVISRQEPSAIWVQGAAYPHSILVPWSGGVQRWPAAAPAELQPAHFEQLLALQPELVIFGSGPRLTFVRPSVYRALVERGIGVETMDTPAACRTYNVLAGEGRQVVAALLLAA